MEYAIGERSRHHPYRWLACADGTRPTPRRDLAPGVAHLSPTLLPSASCIVILQMPGLSVWRLRRPSRPSSRRSTVHTRRLAGVLILALMLSVDGQAMDGGSRRAWAASGIQRIK